ncbi:unnamed protein product, partial [Rotaria magnacalcarata]
MLSGSIRSDSVGTSPTSSDPESDERMIGKGSRWVRAAPTNGFDWIVSDH